MKYEGRMKVAYERQKELSSGALIGEYKASAKGEIFFADQALAVILGYGSPDELVPGNLLGWCRNASDGHRITELLRTSGTIENLEFESVTRGGTVKNLQLNATMNLGMIEGTIKDITEMRQLDHRLLQSQKLESLGTLAGGIAHDFNNILGIIQGHLSFLERYHDDPLRFGRSLEAIQNATDRGATLAKQILTFARERTLAWSEVRVNDIVTELAKLLLETFPRTVNISTFLQGNQPLIAGDSHLLHQMLFNLCINARDAMPKGGNLSIATTLVDGAALSARYPQANSGQYIRIDVHDTGTGMDGATLQKIFEPFFTTKTPEKGTGLGLSIVRSIADGHQGFLDVQSVPGEGTAFFVFLPVREHVAEAAGRVQAKPAVSGGSETILLVEDEGRIRELMETILTSSGYSVIPAANGIEGLQKFLEHHAEIDLIVSDLGLPKMNGADMLQNILELDPGARIILASGFIDPEAKVRIQQMGIRHILSKPYMPDTILHKVRQALDEGNTSKL
jgi:two-component system, cell cycle sensor histidine kinase and response regulator CckA